MSLRSLISVQSLAFISDDKADVIAFLTHSRAQFNSSSIPTIVSSPKLWGSLVRYIFLRRNSDGLEERFWKVFMLSETLQWTPTIVNFTTDDTDRSLFEQMFVHLVKNTRYFCKSLKCLRSGSLTAESFALICNNVPDLEVLDLSRISYEYGFLDDDVMRSSVAKLNNLREMSLDCLCDITDKGIAAITKQEEKEEGTNNNNNNKNKSLEILVLNGGGEGLTDVSLGYISNYFIHIRELCLYAEGITDKGLQQLAQLVFLEKLDLRATDINGTGLGALSALKYLTHLDLRSCTFIKDEGVTEISKITSLKYLNFSGCFEVGDEGVKNLANLTLLEHLDLTHSNNTTDAGLSVALPCLKKLKFLSLGGVNNLGEETMKCLIDLEFLEEVHLAYSTKKYSEASFKKLQKKRNGKKNNKKQQLEIFTDLATDDW